MPRYVTCLTTAGSQREGEKLARRLVEKRLVACVTVVPGALSFYHWKKKLCREREAVLILKTVASQISALEKELHRIHPYELPEFIVLPIISGSKRYLQWLKTETRFRPPMSRMLR